MNRFNTIQVHEHQKLSLGGLFKERHLKALLKLNELHSFNYIEATASGVQFKSYVGIIQVDQLIIEVLPKIDMLENIDVKWQDVLLDMLKLSKNLKAYESENASVKKRNRNLLEVYLEMFLGELERLMKRGLSKQYRLHTSNALVMKGKLELAGHLQKNLVHKERFYTTHQVYDYKHIIHQILDKAADIVIDMTRHSYLATRAQRVALSFPEIAKGLITLKTFDKIVLTRRTKQYARALDLARIIIENYSPSIITGNVKMLALLFNMNNLWEQYVYQVLKRGESRGNYKVSKPSKPLLDRGSYSLQPDILIDFNNGKKLIIDTKWKIPKNRKASISDLRQIYTYNHYWKATHGILLYPGNAPDTSWMLYQDGNNNLMAKLAFVNILSSKGKLNRDMDIVGQIMDKE